MTQYLIMAFAIGAVFGSVLTAGVLFCAWAREAKPAWTRKAYVLSAAEADDITGYERVTLDPCLALCRECMADGFCIKTVGARL